MNYTRYGFDPVQVERIKAKLRNPAVKERVKAALKGVTKYDLQDRAKVRRFVDTLAGIFGESMTAHQKEHLIQFVLAQKIDPNNKLHLIKLWGMFR